MKQKDKGKDGEKSHKKRPIGGKFEFPIFTYFPPKDSVDEPIESENPPQEQGIVRSDPPGPDGFDWAKLQFEIRAFPEAWRELALFEMARLNPDSKLELCSRIGHLFLSLAEKVCEDHRLFESGSLPRGPHARGTDIGETEADVMVKHRRWVAACRAVFEYWLPRDNKPEEISRDLKKVFDSGEKYWKGKDTSKLHLDMIVYVLWKHEFRDERDRCGLLFKKSFSNFRNEYIYKKESPAPFLNKIAREIVGRVSGNDTLVSISTIQSALKGYPVFAEISEP